MKHHCLRDVGEGTFDERKGLVAWANGELIVTTSPQEVVRTRIAPK